MKQVYDKKVNKAVEKLFSDKNLTNKKVLDLGCAIGVNSLFLAERGAKVDAVDINEDVFNKFKHKNINQIICDIGKLEIDQKYDIVLVLNVLHFFNLENIKETLPKILKLVKKGGFLIIQMYNSDKTKWIDKQFGNFNILKRIEWKYQEQFPKLHTHQMIRWVLKK